MSVRHLIGDCRAILPTLPAESVHCVVTSPPYFGLRDYGTGQWEGGDPACGHNPTQEWIDHNFNAHSAFGLGTKTQGAAARLRWFNADGSCRCGATRIDRQIGLEATPEAFVAELVGVFREVRRVLRRDGTCWINLGDSYSNAGTRQGDRDGVAASVNEHRMVGNGYRPRIEGLKNKDLIGIPWMVAFALRADGWYLRSDIIWSKPNPMPESVTDRPTKAHEYLFLLSRSERYFYDAEAIREELSESTIERWAGGGTRFAGADEYFIKRDGKSRSSQLGPTGLPPSGMRNRRSVWTVATHSFSDAHFATFPPALIEPCIKAGVPERCCAKCGAPWVREVEREVIWPEKRGGSLANRDRNDGGAACNAERRATTLGFSPSCACEAGTVPGTVLDCFGGAGTTGLVADRLQRNAILIELSDAYAAMATKRISSDRGPLLDLMEAP